MVTALLVSLLAGAASAQVVTENDPAEAPPPVVESGSVSQGARFVLVSRIGQTFAAGEMRPPVEVDTVMFMSQLAASDLPATFALGRITPNPVAGSARISFEIPATSEVRLEFLDVAGRVVSTLASGPIAPGRHRVEWRGTDRSGRVLAPGLYFLRMEAHANAGGQGFRRVEKVMLLR